MALSTTGPIRSNRVEMNEPSRLPGLEALQSEHTHLVTSTRAALADWRSIANADPSSCLAPTMWIWPRPTDQRPSVETPECSRGVVGPTVLFP